MQNINTDELFPLRNGTYKLATLLIIVLIAYASLHRLLSLCETLT